MFDVVDPLSLEAMRRWDRLARRSTWVALNKPAARPGYGVVYELVDPCTFRVRYVGQTAGQPWRRLLEHVRNPGLYTRRWVYHLRAKGAEPLMRVLEWAPVEHLDRRERAWIATRRAEGAPIFNR